MRRPYLKKRVDELAEILARSKTDPAVLEELRQELRRRKTQRARSLREEVEAALAGATADRYGKRRVRTVALEAPSTGSGLEEQPLPPPDPLAVDDPPIPEAPPRARRARITFPAPDVDSLLATWIGLEVLDPPALPSKHELQALGRRMVRRDEHPEPWSDAAFGPRRAEREVYWWVFLGEIDLERMTNRLLREFPDNRAEAPVRVKGTTTFAVVVLDGEGRPVEGKTFLSSFAWGCGRVLEGRLRNLPEFSAAARHVVREIEQRLVCTDDEGVVQPTSSTDLDRITGWLREELRLPEELVSLSRIAVRLGFKRRQFEPPEPELLNSFFLDDLNRVRDACRSGDAGAGLLAYLRGQPRKGRADVVRDLRPLGEALAPASIPLMRWPGPGRHALTTMQQAAVNHASRDLADAGLVGINGPPGTGKTTLLRDLIAKIVLDRAQALARFREPEDAFIHAATMSAGRGYLHLYRLVDSLLGHEIVVASSNNNAVENISREIPASDQLADFEPPLRYLSSVADRVAKSKDEQAVVEGRSWGLVAAVLGSKANRREFSQGFWWDDQRGLAGYLKAVAEGWLPAGDGTAEEKAPEVLELEAAPRDPAEARTAWRRARARFRDALAKAKAERAALEEVEFALQALPALEAEESETIAVQESLESEIRTRRAAEEAVVGRAASSHRRVEELTGDRKTLLDLRPGFFSRLFGTVRFREWKARMSGVLSQLEAARRERSVADAACDQAVEARERTERRLEETRARRNALEKRLAQHRARIERARQELGDDLPDEAFWRLPDDRRQLRSPWLGKRFQHARDELFVACFDLHRAFVDAAAKPLRHNLGAAMQLLAGRGLSAKQEPARRSLWATLFLVVPVVSTTFASIARMFGPLGREQLGWLLIDEAGQALPQAAVGAIWRSERIVAIGDPMQIEPIVGASKRLVDAIALERGVDPEGWTAPLNSVQSLADRASWFGTTLSTREGDVWIGSPLRVHRRCDEPMFSISNETAYEGMMVHATKSEQGRIGQVLGESGWYPIHGGGVHHWSDEEGKLAEQLLRLVFQKAGKDSDLFFITPFRLVMQRLRQCLAPIAGREWTEARIGTIYTFQGRQAEAVVLVLGAPSPEARGARAWAGASPNLLNVAVSRAKRRLYVIGHREAWKDAGVFQSLAARLPAKPVPPRGDEDLP